MNDTNNHIETEQEREEGHVDTRKKNFECENKDPHLGCDPGIDVAGQDFQRVRVAPAISSVDSRKLSLTGIVRLKILLIN